MKLLDVYPLFNVEPVQAKGCWIIDRKGDRYLDFYGGHAVISIGHSHPTYAKLLKEQIDQIIFYSNSVVNSIQREVAEKLIQVSGVSKDYRLFMINSGAEANENAVKLASMANRRNKFVVLEKGFHGRTAAAISLTDGMKHKTAFNLDFEIIRIPINDLNALENALSSEEVCAVMVEPIQGIGGIYCCTNSYLQSIRSLTRKNGTLWIADEVQCGFGRSGNFFAFQESDVEPDIITMAKGMGNGFPVGGILIKKGVLEVEYGMAGTTFGGNHLASRAVLAVLKVFEEENLIQNAQEMGDYLITQLKNVPGITAIRGKGLMLGIEMAYPVADMRKNMVFQENVFTGSSSNKNTIRLLPPLNVTKEECDIFITAFKNQAVLHL